MRPSNHLFSVLFALLLLGCPGDNTDDFDGDGASDATDCAPADPTIGPGFADPWGDGIDSDCDGSDGLDRDGDGFASNAMDTDEQRNRDCDDTSVLTFPGAADAVGDGVDSNCDGTDGVDADGDGWASAASGGVDCDDEDPDLGLARDVDEDGVTDCDGDCDDLDASRNPTLPEACDGVDTDCDPTTEPAGGESVRSQLSGPVRSQLEFPGDEQRWAPLACPIPSRRAGTVLGRDTVVTVVPARRRVRALAGADGLGHGSLARPSPVCVTAQKGMSSGSSSG